jgi:hypothetical protein
LRNRDENHYPSLSARKKSASVKFFWLFSV